MGHTERVIATVQALLEIQLLTTPEHVPLFPSSSGSGEFLILPDELVRTTFATYWESESLRIGEKGLGMGSDRVGGVEEIGRLRY